MRLLSASHVLGPDGGIGRRASFRCWFLYGSGSSSLLLGTKLPTQHNSLQVKNLAKMGYFDNALINLYHQRPLYLALISGQINGQKS